MRFFVIFCLLVSKFFFGQEATDTLQLNTKSFLYDLDKLSPEFFADRRKMLRTMMPDKSVAFILANPIRNRSNDVNFEYHQDPNMYYLSGFEEPHSLMVIFKEDVLVNSLPTNEILFVQKRNPDEEVWDGKRLGVDGAESVLKVKMAMNASEFKDLELNLENFESIHVLNAKNDVNDNPFKKDDLFNLMQQLYAKVPLEKEDEIDDKNIASWLSMMREIKTPEELLLMRRAIEITCEAQIELMKYLEPEMKEYQAEAVIEYVFKKNGAEYPGFPSILGSGENSCILHYTTNRKTMKGNNLLVSDVGAEYHGYTADVTRTIPLDGSFSKEERIIYQIVYDAQKAGIEACKPGNRFWDPNIAATTVISQRLKELGIIKKPFELRRYFMHGTSHYLGLDVHDMGTYGFLQPNSVITVEPGIYIAEGSPCDPKWWNIGVRIEDDVLITSGDPEVISDCVPKTIEEIEDLMELKSYLNNK